MTEGGSSANDSAVQGALAGIDPNMATISGQLLRNFRAIDTRVTATETSQKAMQQDLPNQIDALAKAIQDGSDTRADSSGGDTGHGSSNGIEHMFQRADSVEDIVKRPLDQALAKFYPAASFDPFAVVVGPQGEFFPAKTWGGWSAGQALARIVPHRCRGSARQGGMACQRGGD